MKPKVGEYWWMRTYQIFCPFILIRIIQEKDEDFVCRVCRTNSVINNVKRTHLELKWEPNWFWKLLGYK